MLSLLLYRHAKSDWGDVSLNDFDRALAPRGIRASEFMAHYILDNDLLPDRILCSTARRARHTLLPLIAMLREPIEVAFRRDLYNHSEDDYLSIVRGASPARRLMILAHNPATELTAARLCGDGDPALRADMATKFPTAGLAEIAFDASHWEDVGSASGRLVRFVKPRELMGEASR